jgi:uncharacterized membrane protein YfcA
MLLVAGQRHHGAILFPDAFDPLTMVRRQRILWRILYLLFAATVIVTALGAFVDYWVHTVHTVHTEGVIIFWTSLVVWIIAMVASSRPKEVGGGRRFAVIFWTGLVWILVIGLMASGKHCEGSLAEYLRLGELEHCTGP